jgi:hypothetical protein
VIKQLYTAFVTEGMLMLLYQSMTPEWPTVLAYHFLVIGQEVPLIGMTSKVELRAELSVTIKRKEKPSDLLKKI